MFLSSCELNPVRRGARKLLGSPQAMHAAILSCFPPSQSEGRGRVLWRLDQTGSSTVIFMVSNTCPDFTSLTEQAGWPHAKGWRSMPYEQVLDSLKTGDLYSFRLTANPTHAVRTEGGGSSKRLGHITAAQQEEWLLGRAGKHGFSIPTVGVSGTSHGESDPASSHDHAFQVVGRSTLSFRRNHGGKAGTVTLSQATYSGALIVTDVASLRDSLINGIGPAKAYGCGLLTLAKPPSGSFRVTP